MDKANGKTKKHPSRRVYFLLQKNTGNDECQIMTLKEVVSLALFSCHQPKAEDDDPEPTQKSERIKHTMDYESFKEKFVEDLKDRLDEQGGDVKVSVNTVNKLNESYEVVTVTQAEKEEEHAEEKGEKSVLGELKAKKEEVAKAPKKETIDKGAKAKGGEAL